MKALMHGWKQSKLYSQGSSNKEERTMSMYDAIIKAIHDAADIIIAGKTNANENEDTEQNQEDDDQ